MIRTLAPRAWLLGALFISGCWVSFDADLLKDAPVSADASAHDVRSPDGPLDGPRAELLPDQQVPDGPPPVTDCNDGQDNDGDGTIDFKTTGGDPGCSGPSDTSENGSIACDDGTDNDGDGKIDYKTDGSGDPECTGPDDTSEGGVGPCADGQDNDNDGLTDLSDPGCSSATDASEKGSTACDDGTDNDGDGAIDYNTTAGLGDPGCSGPGDTSESGTAQCDDGQDNDGDGKTDYKVNASLTDPGCSGPTDASEKGNIACDDGTDNDGDGLTDYPADPDCTGPADTSEGTGTTCLTSWSAWKCNTPPAGCVSTCGAYTLTCNKVQCGCNDGVTWKVCGPTTASDCSVCQAAFNAGCCQL